MFRIPIWQQLLIRAAAGRRAYRYKTMRVPTGNAESARRRRQGAHQHQLACHKPGTVQPRHIFGAAA